jgi:hypothetical protein
MYLKDTVLCVISLKQAIAQNMPLLENEKLQPCYVVLCKVRSDLNVSSASMGIDVFSDIVLINRTSGPWLGTF